MVETREDHARWQYSSSLGRRERSHKSGDDSADHGSSLERKDASPQDMKSIFVAVTSQELDY